MLNKIRLLKKDLSSIEDYYKAHIKHKLETCFTDVQVETLDGFFYKAVGYHSNNKYEFEISEQIEVQYSPNNLSFLLKNISFEGLEKSVELYFGVHSDLNEVLHFVLVPFHEISETLTDREWAIQSILAVIEKDLKELPDYKRHTDTPLHQTSSIFMTVSDKIKVHTPYYNGISISYLPYNIQFHIDLELAGKGAEELWPIFYKRIMMFWNETWLSSNKTFNLYSIFKSLYNKTGKIKIDWSVPTFKINDIILGDSDNVQCAVILTDVPDKESILVSVEFLQKHFSEEVPYEKVVPYILNLNDELKRERVKKLC